MKNKRLKNKLCNEKDVLIDWIEHKNLLFCSYLHSVKSVRIRSFAGLYFSAFELNMERYRESLRIQSKCKKIRTRKTPHTDTFYAVLIVNGYFLISNPHKVPYIIRKRSSRLSTKVN